MYKYLCAISLGQPVIPILILSSWKGLDDIRNDRFPITEEEGAFLVALCSQVEFGNYDPAKPPETLYSPIIDKYLPKHLRTMVKVEDIAAHHQKIRDMGKKVQEELTSLI